MFVSCQFDSAYQVKPGSVSYGSHSSFNMRVLRFLPAMTTDDRDQMMELCRRIYGETDPKRIAVYALELSRFIQRRLDELKSKSRSKHSWEPAPAH